MEFNLTKQDADNLIETMKPIYTIVSFENPETNTRGYICFDYKNNTQLIINFID